MFKILNLKQKIIMQLKGRKIYKIFVEQLVRAHKSEEW